MRPVAADALLVEGNKVLLIRRGKEPFLGKWAIPGGFLEENETLEQCCVREAKEETGLEVRIEGLLGVFSEPGRDPRGTVGVVFLCKRIGVGEAKGGDDAEEAKWFQLDSLPEMAFDHGKILETQKNAFKNSTWHK